MDKLNVSQQRAIAAKRAIAFLDCIASRPGHWWQPTTGETAVAALPQQQKDMDILKWVLQRDYEEGTGESVLQWEAEGAGTLQSGEGSGGSYQSV